MRKAFVVALLLAIVALPVAFAGVGFCRSMPCCPPHLAHVTSVHQPDCCNTSNCDQAPPVAGEYTAAKQIDKPIAIALVPIANVAATLTIGRPLATLETSAPLSPQLLQRRIALLSTFLI